MTHSSSFSPLSYAPMCVRIIGILVLFEVIHIDILKIFIIHIENRKGEGKKKKIMIQLRERENQRNSHRTDEKI